MAERIGLHTIDQILDRLRDTPGNLIDAQITYLLQTINSFPSLVQELSAVENRESEQIHGLAKQLFSKSEVTTSDLQLEFAPSLASRAAVGYQCLKYLAHRNIEASGLISQFGRRYIHSRQKGFPDYVELVVDILFRPMMQYAIGVRNIQEQSISAVERYKRRSEWFGDFRALVDNPPVSEASLVRDFAKFLFDSGIEFVLEAQTPKNGNRLDVLVPQLGEKEKLVLEAKVFDKVDRDENYLTKGIYQSAQYANDQGVSLAHLLVFNIVKDSTLNFVGAKKQSSGWMLDKHSARIFIISVDLNDTLPASQANEKLQISVPTHHEPG